ncbi:type I asparaginase [Marinobacter sp. DUT-3]|uniref:type I asparaginase n=1 Tax=Marinobacter sp. DUT-3 TaxID=3412036 RepID=UPI003D186FAE
MNRKLLVVYTGGTIGMVASGKGYVPSPDFRGRLQRHLDLPGLDVIELDRLIDSANLTPSDWTGIARVLESHWNSYDGFVVLHGTDTMAYTASALSYMLCGCDKPVILTGAQIPLDQDRSDALDNVTTALAMAAMPHLREVCIYFRNRLLRGNRARKISTNGLCAFDSPNAPWLGDAGIEIRLRDEWLLPPGLPDFHIPEFDNRAVATLTLYPGIPAELIQATLGLPGLQSLIIHSYGAGNPPDANPALIQALEHGVNQGFTILNITQCLQGKVSQNAYATGAALDRIGVIPGSDLTPEAAFAKLHYLLATGHKGQELRNGLMQPLCGDSGKPPHRSEPDLLLD